jgi:hypothetical protein
MMRALQCVEVRSLLILFDDAFFPFGRWQTLDTMAAAIK